MLLETSDQQESGFETIVFLSSSAMTTGKEQQ